jgi:hypothetical protein
MDRTPDSPPLPRRGWSRRCVTVTPALVVPPTGSKMVQPAGVFGPEGWVGHGATWRGDKAMMVPPEPRPAPAGRLAGRHLWGGQLWAHFGHFLCESLSRVWGLAQAEGAQSIVFVPKRPKLGTALRRYQSDMLSLLPGHLPVTVLTEPTEVEELVVPGQGFGLGRIAAGTPEFRRFFQQGFAPEVAASGPARLYLSRSGLGGLEGGALLETRLEAHLAGAGYEIYHPEKHTIADQLARYRAATHVLGLDGSAFHLFGFVARPEQQCGVILRRSSTVFRSLAQQIESFSGRRPDIVSAIAADWVHELRGRPSRNSFGELDFPRLGAELARLGYLDPSQADWPAPAPDEFAADIDARSERKGAQYTRVLPRPRRPARPDAPTAGAPDAATVAA